MRELHGRGWRVLGYFAWMLGAGIALDSTHAFAAAVLLAIGAGLFLLGALQALFMKEAPSGAPE
jgi:hypothetical protein